MSFLKALNCCGGGAGEKVAESPQDVQDPTSNDGAIAQAPKLTTPSAVNTKKSRRSRVPTAKEDTSEDTKSSVKLSLWNQAYDELDVELRKKYEELLSEPIATIVSEESRGATDEAVKILDKSPNHISKDPNTRQTQLKEQIELGLDRMEQKEIHLNICGWKFILQDQVANVAEFVEGVKDFVGEAVKASPEASLIWAGVCLVIPLLTRPALAQKANDIGFAYVTSRMRFYIEMEHLLLPENRHLAGGITEHSTEELKEFAQNIVDLYKQILEFQVKSVLRFNSPRLENLGRDLAGEEDWKGMLDTIKDLEKRIKNDSKTINTSESRRQLVRLGEITAQQRDMTRQLLDIQKDGKYKLPTVLQAVYRGTADRCHADTRRMIRNEITEWANDAKSESMLWLSGPAGTGKSTIARTIAYSFGVRGQLAATYFFKRGDKERNKLVRLFPTIAAQLMVNVPQFKTQVRKSMETHSLDENSIDAMPPTDQFEPLISTPLCEIDADELGMTRVIVVDALDECTQQKDIGHILNCLSGLGNLETVRLRVLLISRPTRSIERSLINLRGREAAYRRLEVTDEKFEKQNASDVAVFLKESFEKMKKGNDLIDKSWPTPKEMDQMISLATTPTPLFIYAETLCLYVNNDKGNPVTRLDHWLKKSTKPELSHGQLNSLYETVLDEVWFGTDGSESSSLEDQEKQDLMDMLRSAVLMAASLPKSRLIGLLGMERDQLLLLENLKPVLKVPSNDKDPVEIIHKSFSDFLLGKGGAGPKKDDFRVDRRRTHAMLALKCINRMQRDDDPLRKDMCYLEDYGKPKDEVDKNRIARHIPPDLEYACLNWVYHLENSQQCSTDADKDNDLPPDIADHVQKMAAFLYEHFLHWLETLSLLSRLSESVPSIRKLLNIFASPESVELTQYLRDAERFALSNGTIIERVPLQAYGAALVFCPMETEIRRRHWSEKAPFIQKISGVENRWNPFVMALENLMFVTKVDFSQDGTTLASVEQKGIMRLWNMVTGTYQRYHGRARRPDIAFAEDANLFAAAWGSDKIVLWDTLKSQEEILRISESGKAELSDRGCINLSRNGKLLAYGVYGKCCSVQLWDAATCRQIYKSEGTGTVALSKDGKMLAYVRNDNTIHIYDTTTQSTVKILHHNSNAHALAFSPDGKLLTSCSAHQNLLWDTTDWSEKLLDCDIGMVNGAIFSPNGQILAYWSQNRIALHHTAMGAIMHPFRVLDARNVSRDESDMTDCPPIAFSLDGSMLACVNNYEVRLWDTAQWTCRTFGGTRHDCLSSVAFSPDSTRLASAWLYGDVRLWDTTNTGMYPEEGDHVIWAVAFSQDGKMMASVSDANTVRLWDTKEWTYQTLESDKTGSFITIAFSPNGKMLAYLSTSDTVQLWDIGEARVTCRSFSGEKFVAFSPDSTRLASGGSESSSLAIWNTTDLSSWEFEVGDPLNIINLVFSHDNQFLAMFPWPLKARVRVTIYDIKEGSSRDIDLNPFSLALPITFSHNDTELVVYGKLANFRRGSVYVLDIITGHMKQVIEIDNYLSLKNMSLSEDGQYLRSNRGSIRLNSGTNDPAKDQRQSNDVLFVKDEWVTRGGRNVLWLPPDYRDAVVAVFEGKVVLGLSSGRMVFIEFTLS